MKLNEKWSWFAGFTAVFAALAAYVFWGTWSLDVVPVMPDEPNVHSMDWSVVFRNWLGRVTGGASVLPDDLFWFGVIGSPYFWQELKFVACAYVSAVALAYFLRGRGLSRLASYGAGLMLAFCGYWFSLFSAGHGGWFRLMLYGVFPLALVDRAVVKGKLRHWLFLGACPAWGLSCQPDIWLQFSLFTAAYFVFRLVSELRTCGCARSKLKSVARGVGVSALVFGVVGLSAIRGGLLAKEGREQQIAKGETIPSDVKDDKDARWIFVTNWSLPLSETSEFIMPRLNGDTSCPFVLSLGAQQGTGVRAYTGALGRPKDAPSGNYRQHSLYVGRITCLLALLGLVLACFSRSRRDVCFFAVAAVVVWMFSLGRYCEPVYRILFGLPLGDSIRCPVKWHHLTELCICTLAAFGMDALCRLKGLSGVRGMVIVGGVALLGTVDIAANDKLFCAGIDLREVRRTNSGMQLTFLRRSDFNNPQVQAMVNARRIVSLANYRGNPDVFLVEVLDSPSKPAPLPPIGYPFGMAMVSLAGTIGVLAYGLKSVKNRT